MNMKHTLTALCTAAVMLCTAAAPVSAAEPSVLVEIDSVSVTIEGLEAMDYTVPVYVRLTENPGLTAIEFGVEVDPRCTAKVITNDMPIISGLVYSSKDSLNWFAWASGSLMEETGSLVRIDVTLPEDAAAGDMFAVNYVEEAYVVHQWNDNRNEIRYGDMGAVEYYSGYITVEEFCDTQPGESGTETGDVNCDNTINILDVILLNKALLAGEKISEQGALNADVDGDGEPTSADSLEILKYTIGLSELL